MFAKKNSQLILILISIVFSTSCLSDMQLTEPRFPPIDENQLTDDQIRLMGVDPENPDIRVQMNLFRTMVRHPELLRAWRVLGDRVSSLASMTDYDRELVIMRLAVLTNSDYEWAQHYSSAVKAGLNDKKLAAVKLGSGAGKWNEWERTLLTAAEQLQANAFISDAIYAALKEKYSDQEIMDFIAMTAHYFLIAMLTNTLGIQMDPHHVQGLE